MQLSPIFAVRQLQFLVSGNLKVNFVASRVLFGLFYMVNTKLCQSF